jgi:hypothetical protein
LASFTVTIVLVEWNSTPTEVRINQQILIWFCRLNVPRKSVIKKKIGD